MNKTFSNPCIRCGTERIVQKKWKETIGDSLVTTTKNVCPDSSCQKKVDLDNQRQKDKYAALRLRSEQRALQRRAAIDAERAAKKHG